MMIKKTEEIPRGVLDIMGLLEKFLSYNTGGLMPFLDKTVLMPSSSMLYLIATSHTGCEEENVRVQGGGLNQYIDARIDAVMEVEKIISRYGGVDEFRRCCRMYKILSEKNYSILKDVSQIGQSKLPNMTAVASLHKMNTHTLRKRIKYSLFELASLIYSQKRRRR